MNGNGAAIRADEHEQSVAATAMADIVHPLLSSAEIALFAEFGHVREVPAGQVLFHSGEFGSSMYVIRSGIVDARGGSRSITGSSGIISSSRFISGGSNVYPREVEEVLAQHPEVFEVCVVGEPDAQWGESVVAFVVTRNGQALDEAGLTAWFVERMASFKKPKKYVFRDELPKNSYGKILKTDLRQWLKAASIAALP